MGNLSFFVPDKHSESGLKWGDIFLQVLTNNHFRIGKAKVIPTLPSLSYCFLPEILFLNFSPSMQHFDRKSAR